MECMRTEQLGWDERAVEEECKEMNETMQQWQRCEAESRSKWVFLDGEGQVRHPLGGSGVPQHAIPEAEWKGWCGVRQGCWHLFLQMATWWRTRMRAWLVMYAP